MGKKRQKEFAIGLKRTEFRRVPTLFVRPPPGKRARVKKNKPSEGILIQREENMVQLFPNWVVKHIRRPNLRTASWLTRPVEVFLVSPKMTKLEIKEYLRKLYNLPVTAIHTANFLGKRKNNQQNGRKYKVLP